MFQEYKRLKHDETSRLNVEWNNNRMFASLNYRLHTDAVKDTMPDWVRDDRHKGITYANEADVLNRAVFGITAKQWKEANPDKDGNMRDYASVEQNLILANLESRNAELLHDGVSREERARKLWHLARQQEKTFDHHSTVQKLAKKRGKING